ncbi:MAG: Rho termination factor N-terminal domain-containing protein, partial [Lachnospiraceae bacterium]|nr:Rho termination factor N-terminal domain-containing protein [Lachnospiraceae bacterium]
MDFKKMSLADLRKYAKELGIVNVTTMKKNELVELLENISKMKNNNQTEAAPKTESEDKPSDTPATESETSNIKIFDGQEYTEDQDSGQMAYGILEVMEGYGFIRSDNYLPGD